MRAAMNLTEGDKVATGQRLSPFASPTPKAVGVCLRWTGLHGSAKALVMAEAARRHAGPVLVIQPDSLSANRLEDELKFYLGEDSAYPLLPFPDWEILPYDRFSPYQDILSDRLAALAQIPSLRQGILIVPAATLMHRLPPRDYIDAHTLMLKVGKKLNRERFRERLGGCGYRA